MWPYEGTQLLAGKKRIYFSNPQLFFFPTSRSSALPLKDRWIDRCVIHAHINTQRRARSTDLCKDMLKDKLSADVLILLNKIPLSTYLIFLTLPIARPSLSVLHCHSTQTALSFSSCVHIFFLLSALLPSPSQRS